MNVCELSQLLYLKREIDQSGERLAELERRSAEYLETTSSKPSLENLTEHRKIKSEIITLKNTIEVKRKLCVTEYQRLMEYITGVEDSFMRQILTYRYIDGFSWVQVAMHIGGDNTGDGVRKAHTRFLKKNT